MLFKKYKTPLKAC